MEPQDDPPVRFGEATEPECTDGSPPNPACDPLDRERVWRLTYDQSVRLMEMLNAEPRPIEALQKADARRRDLVAD